MLAELTVFAAFYLVALVAHAVTVLSEKGESRGSADDMRGHRFALIVTVIAKASYIAFHEYAVHFIVYSGYVIHH